MSAEPIIKRVPLTEIKRPGKIIHVAVTRINPSLIDKAAIVLPTLASTQTETPETISLPTTEIRSPSIHEEQEDSSLPPTGPSHTSARGAGLYEPLPTLEHTHTNGIPVPPNARAISSPTEDVLPNGHVSANRENLTVEKEKPKQRVFSAFSFDEETGIVTYQKPGEETVHTLQFDRKNERDVLKFITDHFGADLSAQATNTAFSPYKSNTYPFSKSLRTVNERFGEDTPLVWVTGTKAQTRYEFPLIHQPELSSDSGVSAIPVDQGDAALPPTKHQIPTRNEMRKEALPDERKGVQITILRRQPGENGADIFILPDGTPIDDIPPRPAQILNAFATLFETTDKTAFTPSQLESTGFIPQYREETPNRPGDTHNLLMGTNRFLAPYLVRVRYTKHLTPGQPYAGNTYELRKYTQEEFDQQRAKFTEVRAKRERPFTPQLPLDGTSRIHTEPPSVPEASSEQEAHHVSISRRQIYEVAAMIHRMNGRKDQSPLTLTSQVDSAITQILSDSRFKDIAQQMVADNEKPTARRAGLAAVEKYLTDPTTYTLELPETPDLLPSIVVLMDAFPTEEADRTEVFAGMRTYFGLLEVPKQVFPAIDKERNEPTREEIMRTSIYAAVARELGQHMNNPSLDRAIGLAEELISEHLDPLHEGEYKPGSLKPDHVLDIFLAEAAARKDEREENAKRERRGEPTVWKDPENEQAARYLTRFMTSIGVKGPAQFKAEVQGRFSNDNEQSAMH